ncbi:MAG: DUF2236 domain-containing protein, partial [Myxococcales bacterium]|nr:DUF2236 domain-containing protein [Myxococcales bacterium]
ATIYLFSTVFTGGLRILGMDVSEDEGDDYFHLWRYVGVMIGVEPELLPWSEADAAADVELIHAINGEPDDDSRALTSALFVAAEESATTAIERRLSGARMDLMNAICRRLIGDEFADALGLERGYAGRVLPLASTLVAGVERLRRRSGRLAALAERASAAYWEATVETGLRGVPATFSLPRGLFAGPRPG